MKHGKPIKIVIDTNLWISFLIGLKASSNLRSILTDSSVTIVMTDILKSEIIKVASRPKFARHFASGATKHLVSFLDNRGEFYQLCDIPQRTEPLYSSLLKWSKNSFRLASRVVAS